MSDFTHRDRRAHREVGRALWSVVGLSLGLTVVALALPLPYVGVIAVLGLGVLGLAYVGWAERFLTGYARDLREARDGTSTDRFVRVEVASTVGLDRDERSVTTPSPHTRRGPRRGSLEGRADDTDARPERDQA